MTNEIRAIVIQAVNEVAVKQLGPLTEQHFAETFAQLGMDDLAVHDFVMAVEAELEIEHKLKVALNVQEGVNVIDTEVYNGGEGTLAQLAEIFITAIAAQSWHQDSSDIVPERGAYSQNPFQHEICALGA